MNDERWAEIGAHFEALRELPPQDRAEGLAAIADEEIRGEVGSLLEHTGDGNTVANVVGSAVGSVALELDHSAVREQRVGPWRLVRRLGQGGQGAVFEAMRDDGRFEQRVAVKILKWENDSEEARRRFREERQILSGLEHPHIGRLLDGGETADGTPYLVMEFIQGQRLDVAARDWPLKRKLELFIEVCAAVAYAHRNLIVHRDLKPANILVTPEGAPKLLDFGIARLLDSNAPRTLTAFQALTPDYASPEQVRALPISTASDVYSLGVVLYELITGRKPYTIETNTPLEMDRVICQEPPAPARVDGELDAILAMALRKEPERRYPGSEQFAEDIRRYLDHRPIVAQPDTVWYRSQKYVRRHWVGLLAASITLTAVIGGAGAAVYQARIARQRFEQVRRLAHEFIFNFDDRVRLLPGSIGVREMMVNTALEYLDNLSKDAHGDPGLQWELGKAYEKVGDVQGSLAEPSLDKEPAAIQSWLKAAQLQEDLARRGLLDSGQKESLSNLYVRFAALYFNAGLTSEAVKVAERGVVLARSVSDTATVTSLTQLALAQIRNGEPARALETAREAESLLLRAPRGDPNAAQTGRLLAGVNRSLGQAEVRLARFDEAAGHFRKSIEVGESQIATNMVDAPRRLILDYHSMGDVLGARDRFSLGRTSEAVPWYRKALALAERMSALDPKNATIRVEVARSAGKLAAALELEHPGEAIALYRRALQISETVLPEGPDRELLRGAAYDSLAPPLAKLGRIDEARKYIQAAIAINEAGLKKTPRSGVLLGELAGNWQNAGDIEKPSSKEKALDAYRKSLGFADRAATNAPGDLSLAFRQVEALQSLISAGDPEAAELRQRLVAIWTNWNRVLPGSSFIEKRLKVLAESG